MASLQVSSASPQHGSAPSSGSKGKREARECTGYIILSSRVLQEIGFQNSLGGPAAISLTFAEGERATYGGCGS